eukprot:MONOS_1263.1-p1 / transcript=MONOS_1263.1 / gene=MONOS_1263 / organism=Monocercomonoides_exilis_PA203 / gene_product= very-long-chain enoyl-CoA reductase [EC:1.3.1.93] / transcript_product= very-long-chain enoyl-CoA reductase [EC:1.3.1.93] / location=Mono_scaffold00021:189411-190211(+) / protein_length=267 / sequence_SO=supercontig / SO=protein_coding / is_pseudo=false
MQTISLEPLTVQFGSIQKTIPYNPHSTIKALISNVSVALKISPSRLRLTYRSGDNKKPTALTNEECTLIDYQIPAGALINAKDLGMQVGYRAVFLAEYLGPLLIFWLIYLFPNPVYREFLPGYVKEKTNPTQYLALFMWTAHYGKRLLESVFVHKFSHATMPIFNLFKNCGYYWGFASLIAYVVFHNDYTPPPMPFQIAGFSIWIICEYLNLRCHLHLASLRSSPTDTKHPIPTDPLFRISVCPNYTFEILGWLGFNLVCNFFLEY